VDVPGEDKEIGEEGGEKDDEDEDEKEEDEDEEEKAEVEEVGKLVLIVEFPLRLRRSLGLVLTFFNVV
jgi:hypothetical protein|tara:strand:+ start:163 stop:366 length:204 start_codon:yes stop_codon:yes gene_type:complete